MSSAPAVRMAIRRLVAAWLASNPDGVEDVERAKAMQQVWKLIEDRTDTDADPSSPWAGIVG